MATKEVALSTRNEKDNVEWKVTFRKVTGSTPGSTADRSTLSCLFSSFQGPMEHLNG